jgi:hypothetical protein
VASGVKSAANNWLWYFFIVIGTGAVLSFSFVGKFNPRNHDQPKTQAIVLLWPEADCRPLTQPCAALGANRALVVRLYPHDGGVRLLVKTLGIETPLQYPLESGWLDQSGVMLGESVVLQPAKRGGFTAHLSVQPHAGKHLRVSLLYQGQWLVADLPL